MAKVKTKHAVITSLLSAGLIALIYWILKIFIIAIPTWVVFLLVFIFAFLGMKWGDIF